jgi:hypothetical protein
MLDFRRCGGEWSEVAVAWTFGQNGEGILGLDLPDKLIPLEDCLAKLLITIPPEV